MAAEPATPSRRIGRYRLSTELAKGGMGTVHLGQMTGGAGFSRTVAIKRLHPQLAQEAEFLAMFVDEARLASRIAHPNVVQTLDVVDEDGEVLVVMEYVHGESLAALIRMHGGPLPAPIAAGIIVQMLYGLHAAHEAVGPDGNPIALVHRDVSPHNVVVSADGVARLLDFGVAKATWRLRDTRDGALRGKLSYMAPEQLAWETVDRRTDIFAAAIVFWELLVGQRLFKKDTSSDAAARVRGDTVPAPSTIAGSPPELDAIIARALLRDPNARYATAVEMAAAIEGAIAIASPPEIASWIAGVAGPSLAQKAQRVRALETTEDQAAPVTPSSARRPGGSAARDKVEELERVQNAREADTRAGAQPIPSLTAPGAITTVEAEAAPRRTRTVIFALVGVISVVGVAFAFTAGKSQTLTESKTEAAPVLSASSASNAPTTPAPPVTAAPADSATAVAPTTAASTVTAAATSATAPPKQSGPRGRSAPRPSKATAACNPNYTVDANGLKHFKPECF